MLYLAIGACLGWVATTCLFAWLLTRLLASQQEERAAHRIEVDQQRQEATALVSAQREEIVALLAAHRHEVATLCQRLQAPQIAVAEHMGQYASSDPPPLDLEDDLALLEERKRQLDEFAEELAAER